MGELEQCNQETFRVCSRDFFALFLPELDASLQFETAQLIEKEIDAGFMEAMGPSDADFLASVKRNNVGEEMILYWEQWNVKPSDFEKKMFNFYCRLYLQYGQLVFPLVLYTGPAEPGESQWERYDLELEEYKITSFQFPVIKLKSYSAKEFMEKQPDNPLTWAYLPFTTYGWEQRPDIFAMSLRGIAACIDPEDRGKINTLVVLVELGMLLSPEEKTLVDIIFRKPEFKEARMLHSLRESGIKEGLKTGREEGRRMAAIEHASALLASGIKWEVITRNIGIKPEDMEKDQNNTEFSS